MSNNRKPQTEQCSTPSEQMVELNENELNAVAGGGIFDDLGDFISREVKTLPYLIDRSGLGKGFGL